MICIPFISLKRIFTIFEITSLGPVVNRKQKLAPTIHTRATKWRVPSESIGKSDEDVRFICHSIANAKMNICTPIY